MNKHAALSLAFTYAGCFLGAGYLSGKELLQYFASYGINGFFGIACAALLQFIFGIIIIRLASDAKTTSLDKLIWRWNNRPIRSIISAVSLFFMFGIVVIMTAGAGALINRVTGLTYIPGCAVFIIAVALLSSFGVEGMIKTFSYIVPILAAACTAICAISLFNNSEFIITSKNTNPLLNNWAFSSINYVSYNLFGTIGILSPVAVHIKSKRSIAAGVALGCAILLIIALPIILTLFTNSSAALAELPMLEVSYAISPLAGILYALLLLLGMIGTSLSSLVACVEHISSHIKRCNKKRPLIIILALFSFIGSLAGFGELVSVVYPICGYLGFAALVLLSEHYIHIKINGKKIKQKSPENSGE